MNNSGKWAIHSSISYVSDKIKQTRTRRILTNKDDVGTQDTNRYLNSVINSVKS